MVTYVVWMLINDVWSWGGGGQVIKIVTFLFARQRETEVRVTNFFSSRLYLMNIHYAYTPKRKHSFNLPLFNLNGVTWYFCLMQTKPK